MSRILYWLILIPMSYMPFSVLYVLSDIVYAVFRYVIPYRKEVIVQNLTNSFPNKSASEIERIRRDFYKHFCDLLIESVKLFTISKKQAIKRMRVTNPDLVNKYFDLGRDVILVGGHYNNWELIPIALPKQIDHQGVAFYTKLSDEFFEKKLKSSRTRNGFKMIPTVEAKEYYTNKTDLTAMVYGADQSPNHNKKVYWMEFLGQETAVAFGAEKYSVENNEVVLFAHFEKVKRGHYEMTFELITDDPSACPLGYITQKHTKMLEEHITKAPEYWLWTHRRWKRKRKAEEEFNESIIS